MCNTRVLEEARALINTPFKHQGRTGVGLDCLGLFIYICKSLNIRSNKTGELLHQLDSCNYSTSPNTSKLIIELDKQLYIKNINDISFGDIALFSFNNNPQHLGILGNYYLGGFSLIHSYSGVGRVTEHVLDNKWFKRLYKVYSLEK